VRESIANSVPPSSPLNLGVRSLLAISISAALILVALLLWQLVAILVLVFAGALLATFINSLTSWVEGTAGLARPWALSIVGLSLVLLMALLVWGLAPYVSVQVQRLNEELPGAFADLSGLVREYPWGRLIFGQVSPLDEYLAERPFIWGRLGGFVTTTLGLVVDVLVIIAVGAYFAINPKLYISGLISLAPAPRRARLEEVFGEVARALRWWLAGRVLAMLGFGTLTGVVLWLLGVPMALTLGLLTGLLAFIPFLGPLVALVPAVLLAAVQAPVVSLWVVALFVGMQLVESFLLLPRIQYGPVDQPIGLMVVAQVIMTVTVGVWGWLVAAPLVVLVSVLIKSLYVEEVLGDDEWGPMPAKAVP
jgi:predicted PurR-regulated permease PerM